MGIGVQEVGDGAPGNKVMTSLTFFEPLLGK